MSVVDWIIPVEQGTARVENGVLYFNGTRFELLSLVQRILDAADHQ